ncbi:MAG: phosphate-selective porin [Crocinitomicaceae bacterium]|jgi:hypothetical protein|nr:phosphate-selective porin [Crocinitomicaceae bacterium]
MSQKLIFALFFSLFLFSLSGQTDKGIQVFTKNQNGIRLVAKDSLFSCQFQFRMQNRFGYESKSETDFTPETFEFRVRRLRLKAEGFIYNPKWTYKLQLSFSRGDMDWEGNKPSNINTSVNVVRDAVVSYNFTKDFSVTLGQTKLPGNRQRVISSGDQQFVDRSIVNATLTLDRDFGVFLSYDRPYYRIKGAVTSGEGRNSTRSDKGLSYTGRLEILPLGKFTGKNDYVEGDLEREQKPKISIAGTYNYNVHALRSGGQLGDDLFKPVNIHNVQLDVLFKYKGFAFYDEYCLRLAEDSPVTANADMTQFVNVFHGFGNLAQLSYLFKNNYEIAVRYAFIKPYSALYFNPDYASVNVNGQDHYHLGVSKYINGHRLKVQANLTYNTRTNYQLNSTSAKVGAYFQVEVGI